MSALAGLLTQRITISRSTGARDAIGGDAGALATIGTVWAAIAPKGGQPLAEGEARTALPVWAATLRPFDLRVGDTIAWGARTMIVRSVTADPTEPDRIEAIMEEQR